MKSLLNRIVDLLRSSTSTKSAEEEWLAQSTDLVDLERRQKMLTRGTAPFQVQANSNLKGWV